MAAVQEGVGSNLTAAINSAFEDKLAQPLKVTLEKLGKAVGATHGLTKDGFPETKQAVLAGVECGRSSLITTRPLSQSWWPWAGPSTGTSMTCANMLVARWEKSCIYSNLCQGWWSQSRTCVRRSLLKLQSSKSPSSTVPRSAKTTGRSSNACAKS